MLGCLIMIVGAILQASSFGYAQMIVARIVTGLGNGLNVSATVHVSSLLQQPRLWHIDSRPLFLHITQSAPQPVKGGALS